eukprot:scaffold21983_cov118-Isochrysis_galbana.AAC.3
MLLRAASITRRGRDAARAALVWPRSTLLRRPAADGRCMRSSSGLSRTTTHVSARYQSDHYAIIAGDLRFAMFRRNPLISIQFQCSIAAQVHALV